MRRSLNLTLLLLPVFCAGAAGGAWLRVGRGAVKSSAHLDREPVALTPVADAKRGYATDEEMLTAIMTALAEMEELRRGHLLHEAIGRLSSAEFSALFAHAVKLEDRERRDLVLTVLLTVWPSIDASAAEAAGHPFVERYRRQVHADFGSVGEVIQRVWAVIRPEASLAAAMGKPDAGWARWTAETALEAVAGDDPARRIELLRRQPPSRLREALAVISISALAEKDTSAAEASLDVISDARERARMQAHVLEKLASRDPAAALARLSGIDPNAPVRLPDLRFASATLRAAAREDSAAALAAVTSLPESLQSQALSSVLVGWAEKEPGAALAWAVANGVAIGDVHAFSSYDDGYSYRSLLSTAFENDRENTIAWLHAQPVSAEREALLSEVVSEARPAELEQLFGDLTPAGQVEAVRQVLRILHTDDASRAESWVQSLPPGPLRLAAIRSLTMIQSEGSVDGSEKFVAPWSTGAERDAALRGLVSGLCWQ